MVKYLLTTFHTHDEEIETIHLPVVFTAILRLLAVRSAEMSEVVDLTSRTDALLGQPFNAPCHPGSALS